jgi:hypothetical protein
MVFSLFSKQLNDYNTQKKKTKHVIDGFFVFSSWFFHHFQYAQGKLVF